MSNDPRIASAIAHWAPRFVSNGVILDDFNDVTRGLARWEDWCSAWSVRAAVHEKLGRAELAEGNGLTAGEHLLRAAVYYHFAKFVFVEDPVQMRAAHMKAVECKTLALPYLTPAGERVAIPFEGTTLAAVLRKPAGPARMPLVIMISGLDSTKEEMDAYEAPFHARGMATLAFDGPGQGEAEYAMPIRGDYETPVRAVVDWLLTRPDVDGDRIGAWGVSLGGYYAPRAVAYERRIRACISISGPWDWGDIWDHVPLLTRAAFRVRSHKANDDEGRKHAATLTLKDAASKITCPLFIVAGREDRLVPAEHAERIAAAARGPVELLMVDDGGHNANNRPYRYRSRSADWMARQLGVAILFAGLATNAAAQSFPSKPIRLIAGASAGSASDLIARSVQERLSQALGQPVMSYASAGTGTSTHMSAEKFRYAAGFDGIHVPYKGSPEAITDVLTGRVDFFFAPLVSAVSQIRDGRVQALAVGLAKRTPALPNVPSTVEAGYPNSDYNFWVGMLVAAKTPREIVDRLSNEIANILQVADVRERIAKLGADPLVMSSAAFTEMVRQELQDNAKLVRAAGIKGN